MRKCKKCGNEMTSQIGPDPESCNLCCRDFQTLKKKEQKMNEQFIVVVTSYENNVLKQDHFGPLETQEEAQKLSNSYRKFYKAETFVVNLREPSPRLEYFTETCQEPVGSL